MTVGHAMCDDAEFIDVTIDLLLVMFYQGRDMSRDGSFDIGRNVVPTRESPAAFLASERLSGSTR